MLQRKTKLVLVCAAVAMTAMADGAPAPLRVCATSNNFPFSDQAGTGFENKIAELVAAKLGTTVSYTWWPARENFLDRTLKKGRCDVVMGVPAELDDVATTRPYYRSSYVFVSRSNLQVSSLQDPRLKHLRIGVYLIGDVQTPPALALSREGINDNVHGYMTFFDRSSASSRLISALDDRSLDVAAVWGPLVGYYARHAAKPLAVTPIENTHAFAPLTFQFDIAMGVRKDDEALRQKLDRVIAANLRDIQRILTDYGVPVLPMAANSD